MNACLRSLTAFSILVLSLSGCGKSSSAIDSGTDFGTGARPGARPGIIGGTAASDADTYSKTVAALYDLSLGSLCTASILSDSLLVTAAHCLGGPPASLRVIFGKNYSDKKTRVVQNVVSYEVSPLWAARWNEEFNSGDIALVRFSGGLPAGYHPAKLLVNLSDLKNGGSILLAGYGVSDSVENSGEGVLRSVEVPLQNVAFSQSELLVDQSSRKGACHGDSGGPGYVKINQEWVLWGVTNRSVNDPSHECVVSTTFASLPFYKDWIETTSKKLLAAPPAGSSVVLIRIFPEGDAY